MLNDQDFNKDLADEIGSLLKERRQTIAVAESVTAGQLQTSLSLAERALDFFQGGITAYNIGQKSKHLGIDPVEAMATDCVSENIAAAMARNVTRVFNCNWGIGITGYASTVPEKNIEELFACFAICFQEEVICTQRLTATVQQPIMVRHHYCSQVLTRLLQLLKNAA
jgi:PncC family amidohydrolase